MNDLFSSPVSTIRKRDGSMVPFDLRKIVNAIANAGRATGEFERAEAEDIAFMAHGRIREAFAGKVPGVEEVQDIVEDALLASPYRRTAKAYIIYRDQRSQLREFALRGEVDKVDQYLGKLDWRVRENSNMAYSLQGLNNYVAGEISKSYWLNKVYPAEIRTAHQSGVIHIHDLGSISSYCVGWDLYDLLVQGFRGVPGKVSSAPARHFRAALGQCVNFLYTLQGESAGAQAFSSFDTLLAPFIRYDGLDYRAVKQAMQEFLHNLNVPTRVGFQSPFTNITLDLKCPSHYRDQPVICGGKPSAEKYGDFQVEMDTLNRAFFEVMVEGDAEGRLFPFPIPTINITKDFDWENPNLDGLWEMTAKYGIPYFSNFVNSDMNPEDARSMCCRLRIQNDQLAYRGGGLFGSHPLTGSIGVVTLNLPRMAYLAKDEGTFMEQVCRAMDLARDSLEIKRKLLEKLTDQNLYPYTRHYLMGVKQRFDQYWKNHFSTIGLVGMNEACLNLLGVTIGDGEGHRFACRVLEGMRARLLEYQKQTDGVWNLEATPAESTSFRFARLDKKEFPEIVVANEANVIKEEKAPFYTNSSHLPVNFSDDIFEILDLQDDLQVKYTGGTVIHLFIGERLSDFATVRDLVRKIAHQYHLPYFSITPTFSISPTHGYLPGEHTHCPYSGEPCEVYSRVVGYLRPVSQWNDGKQQEFGMRKVSMIGTRAKRKVPCQEEFRLE